MNLTPKTLARVHAAAFSERRPWTEAEFANLLKSKGVILTGDAKSFLLGRIVADEAEVLTLATAPDFRRQGLASDALRSFLRQAQARGAQSAFLEVGADNTAAKQLYLQDNFVVVAERPNYYTAANGEKITALIMRKSL